MTKKGTIEQMSKEWVLDKLEEAKPHNSHISNFNNIIDLVKNDMYRARLFHLKPYEGQLEINLYSLKNKGDKGVKKFDKEIIIIDIINPKNSFHKMLVKSFNGCRIKALHKWFPELDDYDIDSLLDDNYI